MKRILLFIASAVLMGSCNYLDVTPKGQTIPHTIKDYRALLTSAYNFYPEHKFRLSWPSDEVGDMGLLDGDYTTNLQNITWAAESPNAVEYEYIKFYKAMFYANEVIDKVMQAENDIVTSDPMLKNQESANQLLAEAHAIRAYCHFDLLNMYAKWYDPATAATDKGIPLALKIDIGQKFPRSTVEEVYTQIFKDIEIAKENMRVDIQPVNYTYRFSKLALTALETRVRLYHQDFDEAFTLSKSIIEGAHGNTLSLTDLVADNKQKPFSKSSTESILALEVVFGKYIYISYKAISATITDLYKSGDKRINTSGTSWGYIGSSEIGMGMQDSWGFPMEYGFYGYIGGKNETERVSFRLSEMYLIAAETALKKSAPSIDDARTYLNALQAKRMTTPTDISSMNEAQLTTEIFNERARELVNEGHRWFDLRRTTRPMLSKTFSIASHFDEDFGMGIIDETKTYSMVSESQYILPFPRSAKDSNPYLND